MTYLPEPSAPVAFAPTPEYPDASQMRALGALNFLFMRAPRYDQMAYATMRRVIQPPVDLRFYKTADIDGVPRAAITWAFLSPQAEAKLLTGEAILPADWASGTQAWIMDVIAPYKEGKLGAKLTRAFLNSLKPQHQTARFVRYQKLGGPLKHVTEYRRTEQGDWRSARLSPDAFRRDLISKGALPPAHT